MGPFLQAQLFIVATDFIFCDHSESEDGRTLVTSKKNLHKIRKNNKKEVFDVSSIVDSLKPTTSDDPSWVSIVKKSLKINVPKMNINFKKNTSSSGSSSSSEHKVELKKKETSPEEVIIPSAETSPPEIINISDDNDLSSIESLFTTSKNETKLDQLVPKTIKHKNEVIARTSHFKPCTERKIIKENKRDHELAFSTTYPEDIIKVQKSKRTK